LNPTSDRNSLRRVLLNWKTVIPAVLALAVVLAFGVYTRPSELAHALRGFSFIYLVPILGLALLNYVVRFVRWQYYLRVVGVDVEARRSAGVFFSGLALSVTPGKIGELFKCVMLKREIGAPYSRTVPVVVNERLTDLLSVVLLAGLGVIRYPTGLLVFVVGMAAVTALIVALALSPRLADRLGPWLGRRLARRAAAESAQETAHSFARLLGARSFALGTALGVLAWFCECLAFWLVFPGLGVSGPSLLGAGFVYALATLAGAVSFLPGGLGATEVSMAAMLGVVFQVPRQASAAATLVIRACTLWFAVLVGIVVYTVHMKRYGREAHDD